MSNTTAPHQRAPLTRSFGPPIAAYERHCNGCCGDAISRHGGVHNRQRLHHHGDGLELAHLAGHADRGDCVDDVEDLLAPGTLSGQDGSRRQDLEGVRGGECDQLL